MSEKQTDHELPDHLTQPVIRALESVRIRRVADVSRFTRAEIPALHGIGPKSIGPFEDLMEHEGVSYAESGQSSAERT